MATPRRAAARRAVTARRAPRVPGGVDVRRTEGGRRPIAAGEQHVVNVENEFGAHYKKPKKGTITYE
jgi:hypothetical protein